TAARDRVEAAFEARDWAAMRALCAADVTFEDRRRHVLVSHGVDEWIADRQRWARSAVQQERRLAIITGDRVALEGLRTPRGPREGRSECEHLLRTDVEESGRTPATAGSALEDWPAPPAELVPRAREGDPPQAPLRPLGEVFLGYNDHDRAR